jgi:MYXO-CTERM domain-containing protein
MKPAHPTGKKGAEVSIAGYGAALSTLVLAANVEATIVVLTPTPGSQPFSASTVVELGLDGGFPDFWQFNTSVGKSLVGSSSYYDIQGFRPAPFGSTISAGQTFTSYLSIAPSASGTATFGFLTHQNQVGWLQMNLGGVGGDIVYLAAAFQSTPGVSIKSGDVPEPDTLAMAGLGLLAMGAAGVRRRRRERQRAEVAAS